MKELLVIIASVMAVAGNSSYLVDTLRGKVVPHPYTWFIWSIVSCVVFFGQLQKGGGYGSIPTGIAELFTILIFAVSLRYFFARKNRNRAGHIHRSDTYFLIAALLGLIPWIITKDPTISVIVAVTIDVIATIPTLRKAFVRPDTEAPALYAMNVTRHVLILMTLGAYNVATMLHSVTMIITNTIMVLFLLRKK
jgi:hypothetical protein